MKNIKFPQSKYIFGERLHHKDLRIGVVHGMEYRDDSMSHQPGWWYRMRWDNRISLQSVHEDSLTRSCPNCGKKWNRGCDNCGLDQRDIESNFVD